jgi:hypothetical protein
MVLAVSAIKRARSHKRLFVVRYLPGPAGVSEPIHLVGVAKCVCRAKLSNDAVVAINLNLFLTFCP